MKCEIVYAVLQGVMTVLQIITISLFLIRSRKVKEINWLPKVVIIMSTISYTFWLALSILFILDIDIKIMHSLSPVIRINDFLNYGLMFRFN